MTTDPTPLLRVCDLRTAFRTDEGLVRAVDGVSFAVGPQQTFALVGESGCGKSVTAYSILRLLPAAGRVDGGSVELAGEDLLPLSQRRMRAVRGAKISMIFQEPASALNPVFTVGRQIVEAIRLHRRVGPAEARDIAVGLIEKVGIPSPADRFDDYPHQLSGGMRQRVMIAMALSCQPQLLIADEPTTALDVTIQAQILDLLASVQADAGLSILLITHDLAVVAQLADAVAVMYAGKLVELADVHTLFARPLHPYTQGLFRSLPRLGQSAARLETIPGSVPDPLAPPTGCTFHPRCPIGRDDPRCQQQSPDLREIAPSRWCACWRCDNYEQAKPTDPSRHVLGGLERSQSGI